MANKTDNQNTNLDSGTYEIIRSRLTTQKDELSNKLRKLNESRKEVFNTTSFVLKDNQRISTENNCVARGIVAIENICIFGYNVHFGLRTEIQLDDVFSIYRFEEDQFVPQSLEILQDDDFITDYQNLYKYYRDSIFSKFRKTENYLYMIFQTSKNKEDLKAFKWLIKGEKLIYQNDRSIHEVKDPPQFEFPWIKTTLEDRRLGKFSHISILDKVFIEALHGDITFKIENNTDSGKGIYSEKVANTDQQLDDSEYYYADLGNLIAIRIKPYQEDFRAFIFNNRTKEVVNLKTLNQAAVLLPDDQGILFSNGYYLQNGSYKLFDNQFDDFTFLRRIVSPNGEDFLYVFAHDLSNTYVLMSYNIIQQAVETPIVCSGFTLFQDGSLIYFQAELEATRHHQVQLWETPYMRLLKENKERVDDPIYKVGNKQIVQAMAESQEVIQLINKEDNYEGLYEDIQKKSTTILNSYFWINDDSLYNLGAPLAQIQEIANTAIDEFVKVQAQRKYAEEQLVHAEGKLEELQFKINSTIVEQLDQLVSQLAEARKLQGQVIDLKNIKYSAIADIEELLIRLTEITESLSQKTVEFLLKEEALMPYEKSVEEQKGCIEGIKKTIDAKPIQDSIAQISTDLELLIDILNNLKIEDITHATKIIEKISLIFSTLNEARALLTRKLNSLKSQEAIAEFAAQIMLLEQTVTNYLELSTTTEKVDDYYTKVIVQLEELEGKFSEFDDFALKIVDKRDEIIKTFNSRREQLIEQINKRTTSLEQIGLRVLKNIENKSKSIKSREEILSFYASDIMIDKVRQIVADLKILHDVSKAESLENLLKKSQEDALRNLRDKTDLFVKGENIIALGKHNFAVNIQPLKLTLVRKQDDIFYHLTGTSFYQKVVDKELLHFQDIWDQEIISENKTVYRASYLAYKTFIEGKNETAFNPEDYITRSVEQNYSENYIKGVHNIDALQIYNTLKPIDEKLDLLRYTSHLRALTQLFWIHQNDELKTKIKTIVKSTATILDAFPGSKRYHSITTEIANYFAQWDTSLDRAKVENQTAAEYLFQTLRKYDKFVLSSEADDLAQAFRRFLTDRKLAKRFQADLENNDLSWSDRIHLLTNWLNAYIDDNSALESLRDYVLETAVYLLFPKEEYQLLFGKASTKIKSLKGNHDSLVDGVLDFNYHFFIEQLAYFTQVDIPHFQAFTQRKEDIIKSYEKELKINEFVPKVLTSFVRNKLINEVYFPLLGNNLAKQLGTYGENKRTARMGMLLLISPPGYGKTTLMEYLAKTMGLHFVKINGPTIGHRITSIDPVEAKTSGEREELKKINIAFEMADNVMLYLDDIQHLSAEFLQKFISLADGQRKIDGIFNGESKTYDLRGKRFCIVMAGNPYTESGSKFQIPDMLANRADVYNLGDVIGDTEHLFNMSLIENAAIENPYLEKIAGKSFDDFYKLIEFVETKKEELPNLEENYLKQDIDDCIATLKHVLIIRDIVIKVNKNYIQSAAMQDSYRTEPPFKMQGSYRNMSKLVAQVVPLMNSNEINNIILAHYESESQTLTTDTESNLLKLKELAGLNNKEEKERWKEIKRIFQKNNKFGGIDKEDKMFTQLLELNDNLEGIVQAIKNKS